MLKLKNIRKSFDGNEVLRGVDFEINSGEVVAIIGPSGSGKSTLVKTINFLVHPDQGFMSFNGQNHDVNKIDLKSIEYLRKHMGMVFQNFGLFPHLSILDNITLGLRKVHHYTTEMANERGSELLRRVGLTDKTNAMPKTLSGGQQQRVGIARALASKPSLLILDEPTSALDPELVGEVLKVIESLKGEDMSMIVVTHEMRFAKEVANRIVFMDKGRIEMVGTSDEIFGDHAPQRVKQFIGGFINQK